ncbi:DarT ssDNA thymidine ADP-ribosyltransferase family protein [Olivibacter ginsenosidimutans]|uniref:DarT ssDNA thymidine ADP-ribosyltransferase family protein n=1 Tax=Olivibacter ginsenosidimutans TaxID=1176537 RepID=UPI0031EDA0CE
MNEHNGKLFNDLANDNLQFGNNEKAIYYFTKAIELKPEVYEYYLNRGNLYWQLDASSLALIDWRKAEELGSAVATELLNKNKPIHQAKAKKTTEFETLLNDFGIEYLYHMTHKSNLENILQYGLLSHNMAHSRGLTKADISDERVNRRRDRVHNFVPFYFNPKNPMLYKRKSMQSEIIILCVDRNLLQTDLKFTDGNAASSSTKFYSNIKDLEKLDWSIINSDYWSDFIDGKRIRCSEILIPNEVKTDSIKKIFCFNSKTEDYVKNKVGSFEIAVTVNQDFYF